MAGMDMVLVAMPSFGGRAPAVAIEQLRKIAGSGARCTLVCVYGSRAYEELWWKWRTPLGHAGFA